MKRLVCGDFVRDFYEGVLDERVYDARELRVVFRTRRRVRERGVVSEF